MESCFQPTLLARVFMVDLFIDPNAPKRATRNVRPSAKRTAEAMTMIESMTSHYNIPSEICCAPKSINGLSEAQFDVIVSPLPSGIALEDALSSSPSPYRREKKSVAFVSSKWKLAPSDIESPVLNGNLHKKSGFRWKRFWMVLHAGFLFSYDSKSDEVPHKIKDIAGSTISSLSSAEVGKENAWKVEIPNSGSLLLHTATKEDAEVCISIFEKEAAQVELNESCIGPLIFLIFWENSSASLVAKASQRFERFWASHPSSSGLVCYLRQASSYNPLRKLLSTNGPQYLPSQLALVRALCPLALFEEVGKLLVAHGLVESIYAVLEDPSNPSELKEQLTLLLACLTKYDFFPRTSGLASVFALLKSDAVTREEQEATLNAASVIRNLSSFPEFRQIVLEASGLDPIMSCLTLGEDSLFEKLLQSVLLLICDRVDCPYSRAIFQKLSSYSIKGFLPLLLSSTSERVHWLIYQIINSLAASGMSMK